MNKIHSALETIAYRDIPQNTDLWPQMAARLHERKSFMQTLRARPMMAIIIIVVALMLLTGVAYAIGNLLGYIPGIGFVQIGSLRVLAEPASQTRQGITVTIEQVVVDSQRTVIVYKAEGLTIAAANSKGEAGGPFGSQHLLRLPDGTTLQETPDLGYAGTPEPVINNIQTEGGWPNYVWRLVYPPVSTQVNELTLLIPVLQTMPAGAAPENWEVPFQLKPAPADMTFAPIITLAAPAQATIPAGGEATTPGLSSASTLKGITFQLDNVVELQGGYVFTGNLSWDDSAFPTGKGMLSAAGMTPVLTDAGGRAIPIEAVQLNGPYTDEHKSPWSYGTNTKALSGPLVLSVASIQTTVSAPAIDFAFDFGPNPKIGDTQAVNREFSVEGHTVRLLTVELGPVPDNCQGAAILFHFSGDIPDMYANIDDVSPQDPMVCSGGSGGGGGGGGPVDPTAFSMELSSKEIPSGLHHYAISFSMPEVVNGPWQVSWNPPASSEPTATSQPEACLTLDKWNQLAGRDEALPPGLGGKIVTTADEGGRLLAIYISNLDGSNVRKIGSGGGPAISADGTRLGYSAETGITVVDLATGESSPHSFDGYDLRWSPDGTRLMYTTESSLFVVNADGSGSQKIDTGQAQVISPAGWLPDNHTIVYATMGGAGFTFTSTDLQSGATKKLFTFQNKAGFGAVSPDGQWISFTDRVFGAVNWGIFISRLDGSQRRLVTSTDIGTAFTSVWSPDGQWLVIDVFDQTGLESPALVNPFTCQVVRLQHINGMIEGWGR